MRKLLPLALCIVLVTGTDIAHAAEAAATQSSSAGGEQPPPPPPVGGIDIKGVLKESFLYETNPLLRTSDTHPLYGSITSPEMILSGATPTTNFNADARVDENLFNQTMFNSTDLHAKAGVTRTMQRWSAGLNGKIDYDTTRTSELSTYGFIASPVRHTGESVTPKISYNLSPSEKLSLTGVYRASQYSGSLYTDYDVFSVTPTYSRAFDPLDTGTFSVQAQRYETTSGARNVTDTIGPSVGWRRILTPRLTADASVGIQAVRNYIAGSASQPWGLQYDFLAALTYKGDRDTAALTASRNEYPFGNGTEAMLTSFEVKGSHELNDRFAFQGAASYRYTDYRFTGTGNLESMTEGKIGLAYHLTDHLDIVTSYRYRHETLTGLAQTAQDHAGLVTLAYRLGT
ncbi:MAG: hypothetical protein KGI97_01085 [Alphaproteobacteria bacterium]|nr:hypothetical protein [Alphaproteobacteria bacterium]